MHRLFEKLKSIHARHLESDINHADAALPSSRGICGSHVPSEL